MALNFENNLPSNTISQPFIQHGEKGPTVAAEQRTSSPSSAAKNARLQPARSASWTLELLSLLLASLSLIAIVAILAHFDGRPVPSSQRRLVTLNTVVSLLTVVLNAGLSFPLQSGLDQMKWYRLNVKSRPMEDIELFNDAGTGVLGAAKLVVTGKGGSLGTLAAFMMIVGLGVSPFAQQLINYPQHSVVSDNTTASINTATNYTGVLPGNSKMPNAFVPNLPIEAALYNGMFAEADPVDAIPFKCPTGNCTWPQFSTLAACGQCAVLSEQVQQSCNNNGSDCVWALPNGATLDPSSAVFSLHSSFPDGTGSMPYAELFEVTYMGLQSTSDGKAFDAETAPWARRCSVEYCVQDLLTHVQHSTLSQTILQNYTNSSTVSITAALAAGQEVPLMISSSNETFLVGMPALLANQAWFAQNFLNGSISAHTALQLSSNRANTVINITADSSTASLNGGQKGLLLASYWYWTSSSNATGLDLMMSEIAQSMTNAFRASGGAVPVLGTPFELDTFVHVRWPWIALPALVLLCTTIFLSAAILTNRKSGTKLWKGSALNMLTRTGNGEVGVMALDVGLLEGMRVRTHDGTFIPDRKAGGDPSGVLHFNNAI